MSKARKFKRATLDNEFSSIQSSSDLNKALHRSRLVEIKAIDDEEIEGCILRSKEQWTELGEKPKRYFYQLEKSRQSRNTINSLVAGSNSIVTFTLSILNNFTQRNQSIWIANSGS